MTNRLELNWKVDGFVDEQCYYCSEIPIDPENLPAPKAVLAGEQRSYVDTAVVLGSKNYIRLSAIKNLTEKFSLEKIAYAINKSEYRLIHYLDNLLELHGYDSLQNIGGVTFSDSGAVFSEGKYLQKNMPFALGSADFKIRFKFTAQAKTTVSDMVLIDAMSNTTTLGWQIYITSGRKVIFYDRARQVNGSLTILESSININYNQMYQLDVIRVGEDIRMLVDNVLVAQKTIPANVSFPAVAVLGVGAQVNSRNANYDYKGVIKDLRIA